MSLTKNAKRHRWALDFTTRTRGDRQTVAPPDLASPVGYSDKPISEAASSRESNPDLIAKKSWDVALGPVKQIPMNLFIMWMAGNSISIFPIMMVGMMFIRPIQALLHIQQTFKMIEGPQSMLMRVVYFLGNLMGLGLAIYKCQVMGLLPTHPSDWLAFVEPQMQQEWTGGGVVL